MFPRGSRRLPRARAATIGRCRSCVTAAIDAYHRAFMNDVIESRQELELLRRPHRIKKLRNHRNELRTTVAGFRDVEAKVVDEGPNGFVGPSELVVAVGTK